MILLSAAIVATKLLVDDQITACVKEICLMGVVYKVSYRKTLSGEKFYFTEKRLLSMLNFCASSNLSFFLRVADWPTINFNGMNCYFPVIGLVNFV